MYYTPYHKKSKINIKINIITRLLMILSKVYGTEQKKMDDQYKYFDSDFIVDNLQTFFRV